MCRKNSTNTWTPKYLGKLQTQMLHGMGIFTKPFPVEWGPFFHLNVGKIIHTFGASGKEFSVWHVFFYGPFWVHLDVSENSNTPKSSILIGFSIINHQFCGAIILGNIHVFSLYQKKGEATLVHGPAGSARQIFSKVRTRVRMGSMIYSRSWHTFFFGEWSSSQAVKKPINE